MFIMLLWLVPGLEAASSTRRSLVIREGQGSSFWSDCCCGPLSRIALRIPYALNSGSAKGTGCRAGQVRPLPGGGAAEAVGCGREWGRRAPTVRCGTWPPFTAGTACSPSVSQLLHARVRACLLECLWGENAAAIPAKPLEDRLAWGHNSISLAVTTVYRVALRLGVQ